jgi:hypothetical protein
MTKIHYYISFAGFSLFLLLGFLLLSPPSQKEGESVLWKKQFKQITIEKPEAEIKDIVLERRGLFSHSHYITYNNESRIAGTSVQNIFRDWSEPILKGIYTEKEMGKSFQPVPEKYKLLLFEAPKSSPVTVEFGQKTGSSDRIIKVTTPDSETVYFAVQDSLYSRLSTEPLVMRERRVLLFPTSTFIEEAQLVYPRSLDKGKSIERVIIKSSENGEKPVRLWKTSTGTEIQGELSTALERSLKQINIQMFRDEAGLSTDSVKKAFQDTTDDMLSLEIKIRRPGESVSLRFREIPTETNIPNKENYLLMMNKSTGETDLAGRHIIQTIISQAERIRTSPPENKPVGNEPKGN